MAIIILIGTSAPGSGQLLGSDLLSTCTSKEKNFILACDMFLAGFLGALDLSPAVTGSRIICSDINVQRLKYELISSMANPKFYKLSSPSPAEIGLMAIITSQYGCKKN
jgi:hypothetical protein